MSTHTSRRAVFGGTAALITTGPTVTTAADPDGVLFSLSASYSAVSGQWRGLLDVQSALKDRTPEHRQLEGQIAPISEQLEGLEEAIAEARATTLRGLRAKAMAIRTFWANDPPLTCMGEVMTVSLLDDLLGSVQA